MSKFKVGDKVTLKKGLVLGEIYGDNFLMESDIFNGSLKITDFLLNGNSKLSNDKFYSSEMLELVEKKPKKSIGYKLTDWLNNHSTAEERSKLWVALGIEPIPEEITNPTAWTPKDKELVWCWGDGEFAYRAVRFYNKVNNCTFSFKGRRDGAAYGNYAPYEGEYPEWAKEALERFED